MELRLHILDQRYDAVLASTILKFRKIGFDYITPKSGGIIPITKKKVKPCYQVKYARQIKRKVNIHLVASGMIRKENEIKKILNKKEADLICVSKPFINNPYWFIKLMQQNNIKFKIPNQYKACFKEY